MAGVGFRRSRDFTLFTFIGHNLLLVYYRRFEYKGNFCKYGLYYTLGSNVITDGTFTWVQLLHLCLLEGLLHVFVSPFCYLRSRIVSNFFGRGL